MCVDCTAFFSSCAKEERDSEFYSLERVECADTTSDVFLMHAQMLF